LACLQQLLSPAAAVASADLSGSGLAQAAACKKLAPHQHAHLNLRFREYLVYKTDQRADLLKRSAFRLMKGRRLQQQMEAIKSAE
jgi:hypothetical protein